MNNMLQSVPAYVILLFSSSVIATLILLLLSIRKVGNQQRSTVLTRTVIILTTWLLLQGILSYKGFYLQFDSMPPRFLIAVAPPLLAIVVLFSFHSRHYLQRLPLELITYIHLVRVPVELTLWSLYLNKYIPQVMTFEGRNLDILAGITAPFIAYFCFRKQTLDYRFALLWNVVSLGLLLNIVIHSILATPAPFQQLAFDQPNIAVAYFPFIWLPSFIVPVVLFCHLISIWRLITDKPGAILRNSVVQRTSQV